MLALVALVALSGVPNLAGAATAGGPSADRPKSSAPKASQQPSADGQAVAVYAAGRDFGPATAAPEELETNLCTEQLLMADPAKSPSWNGWGNGPENTRFQPKSQGKLTAKELPRLELKWAFGYSNVSSARPQPTVVAARVFAPE